jgi:hypothetical protein
VISTRRQARGRFMLGAAATVAGLGAAAIAVATSSSAAVWVLVAYVVATSAVMARHVLGAVRTLRLHSRSRGAVRASDPVASSRDRAAPPGSGPAARYTTPHGTVTA